MIIAEQLQIQSSQGAIREESTIERKYYLIREIVHRGDMKVSQITSEDNLADPFTKGLTRRSLIVT